MTPKQLEKWLKKIKKSKYWLAKELDIGQDAICHWFKRERISEGGIKGIKRIQRRKGLNGKPTR